MIAAATALKYVPAAFRFLTLDITFSLSLADSCIS